jgi:putative ABC transport system substrate-binding protein
MQVRKYLIAIILSGLFACASEAAPLRVSLLVAEEAGVYQEFAQAFSNESQRQSISLRVLSATALPTDTDLVIAVGIKSARIAANSRFPVLCVLVTKAGFEKLLRELPANRKSNTFSALYWDQPVSRQVAMVMATLPEAKNIGLLLSEHSPDVESLRKLIYENKLNLREKQLGSMESLYRDLESVLRESDVLLAIPDAEVYNSQTMRNILLATYRSKVPVVGFSSGYVKAGALCAVFSTPGQLATQAASLTKQFAETDILPAAQYPTEFDVMVNHQVAHSLGITVKENAGLIMQIKAESTKEGTE